jgi:hypothetical protein
MSHRDIDRVVDIVLALAAEVSSIRDRLDSHERIAERGQLPSGEAVEAYRPDKPVEDLRALWRQTYLRRLFRTLGEDLPDSRPAGVEEK